MEGLFESIKMVSGYQVSPKLVAGQAQGTMLGNAGKSFPPANFERRELYLKSISFCKMHWSIKSIGFSSLEFRILNALHL